MKKVRLPMMVDADKLTAIDQDRLKNAGGMIGKAISRAAWVREAIDQKLKLAKG